MPDSQTSEKTNAAKRLHEALLAMKAVPGTYHQGGSSTMRLGLDALPMALRLVPDQRITSKGWELMRAMKLVTEMIDDTRLEVEQANFNDEDQRFYLRDIPRLTEVLSPHTLGQGWGDITNKLSSDILVHLENVDRVLNRRTQERKLPPDQFAPLLEEVSQASEALGQLEIEDALKNFIQAQLNNIRLAVDEYRFRGIGGLQPAIAGYLGALGLANVQLERATEAPEDKGKLRKLLDVCKTGAEIINAARGVAWVWPYLSHGAAAVVHLLAHAAGD